MALATLRKSAPLAVAVVVVGAALVTGAPTPRAASSFVALATGHVGKPYRDQVRDGFSGQVTSYKLVDGILPAGLSLDPITGEISGTPTEARLSRLRIEAATGTTLSEVRAAIAVLTANESELKPGQSFEQSGPFQVTRREQSFAWTSSFDKKTRSTRVLVYAPEAAAGKALPLLVMHRGRGFNYDDYHDFLTLVSSWGIVCASVSDTQSFYSPDDPNAAEPLYDSTRCELGMENASAAQEAAMDFVLGLSQTPGDALAGRIDAEAVFLSGHSRGGGATHASHVRSLPLRTRGVIYFMAFDLRYFGEVAPPAQAPAYAIPTAQDRLPSLVFAAENDGDLTYPIADELVDRATGPTTFVTVYGGVHNFLGDSNPDEGGATITREEQHARIASFVVAFVRRWARDDVSLDGLLYGSESQTSQAVGVASWRRSSPLLLVDDFQDADTGRNLLGGKNGVTGIKRSEASIYPSSADQDKLGLRHSILTLNAASSVFQLALGPTGTARDLSNHDRFLARIEQTGPDGWRLGTWVRLRDAAGTKASVQVTSWDGKTLGFLPAAASGLACDRFVTLSVPLALFKKAAPKLDLARIASLELVFSTAKPSARKIVVDDVRFE